MQRVYTQSILLNFWIVCVCVFFLNFKPFTFFRVPNVVMRFYIGSTLNKGVIRWTETKYTKSKQIIILVDGCWMCVRFLNISNIISFATENIIYKKYASKSCPRCHTIPPKHLPYFHTISIFEYDDNSSLCSFVFRCIKLVLEMCTKLKRNRHSTIIVFK